jgi:hypothetical protein
VDVFHEELSDAFTIIEAWFAPGVTWEIETDVSVIDVASGDLVDVIGQTVGVFTGTAGSGAGTLSRATQATLSLKTDQFLRGRRLQGRLFLGPIASNVVGNDGQLNLVDADAITDAFVAMTSGVGPRMAVYSRPYLAPPGSSYPDSGGSYGDVITATCRRLPGTLRSRKQ